MEAVNEEGREASVLEPTTDAHIKIEKKTGILVMVCVMDSLCSPPSSSRR